MELRKNFRKKVLKNGFTILFEKRELPSVSIAFGVRAGGINEALEEKGISHFIEHLLYKGTKKRNAKQIAEEIEKKGGEFNGFTSEEATAFYCKMPSEHFSSTLEILGDLIKNPLFLPQDIEKERKVIFEEIKTYHDNPLFHVFDEIQKALYTGTLGISLAGTFETMNSVDRKKILKKFNEIYHPKNLILCIVGNASFEEIIEFAEKNFSGKARESAPRQAFKLKNLEKTEKRSGIDQANLIFAYHIPLAKDKKSYAAKILSSLTAEGMSSRLFHEIREKRNLAYAVKGDSHINRDFAYNSIYVGAMPENVQKVKELILKEFEKISKELTDSELGEIKRKLIGNYHISMEDSQMQMVNLLISEIQDKAEELYEFEKNILQVRLKDVRELALSVSKGKYSIFALVPEMD